MSGEDCLTMKRHLAVATALAVAMSAAGTIVGGAQESPVVDMNMKFNTGQTVVPIFEGWEPNKDGTFSLYFGYMNRNYKELLDIPVGPGNRMDPGVDRGQPTHFLPRRQYGVFRVVVPKDFGNNKIDWVIAFRGKTAKISGTLNPLYQIDISRDTTTGNTPPVVQVETDLQVSFPNAVTIPVSVTDDGLPKGGKLAVIWSKFRGPGQVTFDSHSKFVVDANALGGYWGWEPEMKDGKATTTATFSEPGIYVLRATAADGRFGRSCCRTNVLVSVTVNAASTTGRK
jgi:hypothetical protein